MAEKLFPERQRCKNCRGALGKSASDPVYLGLYCTPKCAGIPALAEHAIDAPRECKTQRDGRWVFKRRYRSEQEIPDKIKQDPSTDTYWCNHCGHRHLGHSRMGEAEKFRMLGSPDDLADFLIKRRGKATHAQVAKAAGVRPIRLKELETGVQHAEGLVTLFKVLAVLQTRAGVALKDTTGRL